MNIDFNKCIFVYLCHFYSSTKYFHEFKSIFVNFCFTDISEISVNSKYGYIRDYRYFVPWFKGLDFNPGLGLLKECYFFRINLN